MWRVIVFKFDNIFIIIIIYYIYLFIKYWIKYLWKERGKLERSNVACNCFKIWYLKENKIHANQIFVKGERNWKLERRNWKGVMWHVIGLTSCLWFAIGLAKHWSKAFVFVFVCCIDTEGLLLLQATQSPWAEKNQKVSLD